MNTVTTRLLSDLEVLVRVVEAGSLARAAERMAVTPSMVSKRLSGLESRVGSRLVNRTTRRLSLTPSGRMLYERAAAALADVEDAVAVLGEEQRQPRGLLRMTAPSDFTELYLTEAVAALMKTYPDLRLELRCTNRAMDLVEEGIDLALRGTRKLETSSLVARKFATSRIVVLAAPEFLRQQGAPGHPKDLSRYDALCYSEPVPQLNWSWRYRGDAGSLRIREILVTNQSRVLAEGAAAGRGITFLPSFIVASFLKDGRLVPVLPEYDFGSVGMYLLYPHRKHMSTRVRATVDFLAQWFGGKPEQDPWMTGTEQKF